MCTPVYSGSCEDSANLWQPAGSFPQISTEENLEARGKINMNSRNSSGIQKLEKSLGILKAVLNSHICKN